MLGIIILNFNSYQLTIECVNSIFDTYRGIFKIYIVDGGSTNNSVFVLSNHFNSNPLVQIIELGVNKGFAYGNNKGSEAAINDGCDYLLITNNDVLFEENAIYEMHDYISKNKLFLVFPKVYLDNNTLQEKYLLIRKADYFYTLIVKSKLQYITPRFIKNKYLTNATLCSKPTRTYYFPGCCFMVDSKNFSQLNMLDETTFLYYEEDILSEKANNANLKLYYIPTSTIIHLGGMSTSPNHWKWADFLISKLYYWNNYKGINKYICLSNLYTIIALKNIADYKSYSKIKNKEIINKVIKILK